MDNNGVTVSDRIDILVVGGGVVGLSAAIAMRQRGLSVALLDASKRPPIPNKRVYALNHASQSLLRSLGVWDHIDSSSLSPYRQMHVWDAVNGAHLDFDARVLGKSELGSILEEAVLKEALLQQCAADGVVIYARTRAETLSLEPEGVTVHSDSRDFQTRLLIVADGPNSATRTQLKVPVTTWPYHQHAIVATVQTKKPHGETAFQVFNPDGPLAFLPLADAHHCSVVWSTSPANAGALLQLTDEAFGDALTAAFGCTLGESRLISPRQHFPLHMRHVKAYRGERWILMGDAAHSLHPLAGLGLNLGLADLKAWISLLDDRKQDLCSARTLGAYERERKSALWQTIALLEGIKLIFENPLPPITALRGIGLHALNRLPWIKRFMMEHAAG